MTTTDTAKLTTKLNWFMGVAIGLFSISVYLAFDNAGFKKEIKAENQGMKELFEQFIKFQSEKNITMQNQIEKTQDNYIELLRAKD